MTTTDLIDLLRRRWYIVLAGLIVALSIAYVVGSRPGVYSSRVEVVLMPPASAMETDVALINTSEAMIAAAGLVERTINAEADTRSLTSQNVTLVGAGIRRGTIIMQPNAGGQWDYNFTSPALIVEVAGPSRVEVIDRRTDAVARINTVLDDLQVSENVRVAQRITTRILPDSPRVTYATGYPTRAAVGVVALGFLLTVLAAVLVDRVCMFRRLRHADPSSTSPSGAVSA